MIVIFSNYSDVHTQAVLWALRRSGSEGVILNSVNETIEDTSISVCNTQITRSFEPTTIWWRRPSTVEVTGAIEQKFKKFLTNEWFNYLDSVLNLSQSSAFWVNNNYNARKAESKARQLFVPYRVILSSSGSGV